MLPADVMDWIESAFSPTDRETAIEWLLDAVDHEGAPVGDRLIRCAAVASGGDLEKLRYYVDLLRIDWRDVIVAGEYDVVDQKLVHARDLNQPIPDF